MAKKKDPNLWDWYSDVRNISNEFEMNIMDENIRKMTENMFKSHVRIFCACKTGQKYLKTKQSRGEKASSIRY